MWPHQSKSLPITALEWMTKLSTTWNIFLIPPCVKSISWSLLLRTWNMSVLQSWVYSTTTIWTRDRVYEMLCWSLLLMAWRNMRKGEKKKEGGGADEYRYRWKTQLLQTQWWPRQRHKHNAGVELSDAVPGWIRTKHLLHRSGPTRGGGGATTTLRFISQTTSAWSAAGCGKPNMTEALKKFEKY